MSSALREEAEDSPSSFFKAMTKHYRMSEALEKYAASIHRDGRQLGKESKVA